LAKVLGMARWDVGLHRGGLVKLLLAATIGFFIAAAAYTSILIVKRQEALQQSSRYNVTWLVSQAVTEVAKLQQRVAATAVADSGVDQDEVQLRLDILANRLGILRTPEVSELFAGRDEDLAPTISLLAQVVEDAQPLVDSLDEPGAARRLLELMAPLDTKMARLAATAHLLSGDRTAEDQRELSRLHWIFSALIGALLLCGLALVALLLWNNRLLQRAHHEVRVLAEGLQRTGSELGRANQAVRAANDELQLQNRILQERDRELHTHNERFEAALNNMSQALCMVDGEQRLIVCNRRFVEMFGLSSGLVMQGVSFRDVLRAIGAIGTYPKELIDGLHQEQQRLIRAHRPAMFFEEHEDGRAVAVSHQPMPGGGWVATYEDITERRRVEARINYMAHHDALTSLPNRVLFREQMERALDRIRRDGGELAVLCLDLDHFKNVNDTLGHSAGDALLEEVSHRLRQCVREADVVARLGGDEFAILQTLADGPGSTEALARRLVEAVGVPYELEGHRIIVSVSIGLALAPNDGASADQLLKNADLALYRAKADGRATYRFFEPEMDAHLQARRTLEIDLREALPKGQFEVFYQSLVNLETGQITGFEALVRWRHPTRGLVAPGVFIPVAEEMGLITNIGEWVLRQACADAMEWPEQVKLAVNLSPVQFKSPELVETVRAALAQSGLPASRLELEVTESVLLQDDEAVLAVLHSLHSIGLRIALDDFGTGYSSLSYLRRFPFDKIKIDQSFVREMTRRPDCVAIVNSITGLAVSLGMTTTAEGVETESHLELIRDAGCTEVQGYYFDQPRPAAEVLKKFSEPADPRSGLAGARGDALPLTADEPLDGEVAVTLLTQGPLARRTRRRPKLGGMA
jgi:diguanylate cyclase (GGDEF)-like protein/PAS domain S-box-containing protein